MHLITQPAHMLPCNNLAMKGNNGTNRILYHDHDTFAQTITEPIFSLFSLFWKIESKLMGFLCCPCIPPYQLLNSRTNLYVT
jgi:hypothetical protein